MTRLRIPAGLFFFFLRKIDKLILKFTWKCKGSRIANIIMIKKNKVGGLRLFSFSFETGVRVGVEVDGVESRAQQ